MGRYYEGDIDGKFWFGVQSSSDADYFGVDNINYYHPDEISATMISNYYFNYKEPTPAFKQMVKWCQDYL